MKKFKGFPYIIGALAAVVVLLLGFYLFCPALNLQSLGLWVLIDFALLVFTLVSRLICYFDAKKNEKPKKPTIRARLGIFKTESVFAAKHFIAPIALTVIIILMAVIGATMFNAELYADIITVSPGDFTKDIAESVGTDSIALMDTSSAQMLGDREIGALSDVVSQYDVSWEYTQIDLKGKPVKVAALEYAGFFKWANNRDRGIGGYVTVDPVSMSATFKECEGMIYTPSAFFGEDAYRHLRMKYPTLLFDNLHFEIDEEGKPYYVVSVVKKTIGVFGGKTVSGCIVLDPVTGECTRYEAADVPRWVDVVFYGDLICEQYNWHGMYRNGFFNSLFAKKDCKQVTTYYSSEEDEESDDATPVSDYGYIAKDGDIWIYTGITSVNGDSSNIGFLLANERTGESRYYTVSGADEKSAMAAAEGEVQEKGYQASFPSLINVEGNPTYIMVLKDSGGLVKLYAAVNVEQYNIVTTAATQSECIEKYKNMLGIETEPEKEETVSVTMTIESIKYVTVEGNTYIYLIDAEENIYKAKAADHEEMLLLSEGDTVALTVAGNTITACERAS